MTKNEDYDLFKWVENNYDTRYDFRKKRSIYKLSDYSLDHYFNNRSNKTETLIKLVEFSPIDLYLASISLQRVINSDPLKVLPLFSILLSLIAILYGNTFNAYLTAVIILISIIIAFSASISANTDNVSELKSYIDTAIELQKQKD